MFCSFISASIRQTDTSTGTFSESYRRGYASMGCDDDLTLVWMYRNVGRIKD